MTFYLIFALFWWNVLVVFGVLVVVRPDRSDATSVFLFGLMAAIGNTAFIALFAHSRWLPYATLLVPIIDWYLFARFFYYELKRAALAALYVLILNLWITCMTFYRSLFLIL